jgi:hypothetical protein
MTNRNSAARRAWATRRGPSYRARKSEQASKLALQAWCTEHEWQVIFFEGSSGAPRTGIVDAIIARIRPGDADAIEIRLIQLKAGCGGLTGLEIARLKQSVANVSIEWLLAAFDGESLH